MVGMLRGASANLLFINPVFEATVKIHKGKWSKDQGGNYPFGQLSRTGTVRNALRQKSCLSFLTFRLFVSLTTGNIHKKAGKKASQKAQLYLRDAPPPADFDILT